MPINFNPRAGQILVCDFSGFTPPEMNKVRPVIVISPRLPFRSQIATIVPISTTPPIRDLDYVVKLSKNYHPNSPDDLPCWAKCDMIMNISIQRLEGFKIGRRKWDTPHAKPEDLEAVRIGVIHGLGMKHLLNTLE
ncbi:MAG: type II toxin-antitoxin system PemK/MazF family toxin [Sneathiella sp.]